MAVLFTRAVPLSFTFQDQTVTYWGYALWREDWTCAGTPVPLYSAGLGIVISGSAISIEDAMIPLYYTGSGSPTIPCVAGRDFYVDLAGLNLYFCSGANQWQPVHQ